MEIQETIEKFREDTYEKKTTWAQDRHKINRLIGLVKEKN
jgi:hypothetical protein